MACALHGVTQLDILLYIHTYTVLVTNYSIQMSIKRLHVYAYTHVCTHAYVHTDALV